jgi:hypothetical protein
MNTIFWVSVLTLGFSANIAAAEAGDRNDGRVRDHRTPEPAPVVRDHRTESTTPPPTSTSSTSSNTTPVVGYYDATQPYGRHPSTSTTSQYNDGGSKIQFSSFRFEVDGWMRGTPADGSIAGAGARLMYDIVPNWYLGAEASSGEGVGYMHSIRQFRQFGAVTGIRGNIGKKTIAGVEAALGTQQFVDTQAYLDARVKVEQQFLSSMSLGLSVGRNLLQKDETVAALYLAIHHAQ